jgi:hypothetical protein
MLALLPLGWVLKRAVGTVDAIEARVRTLELKDARNSGKFEALDRG